MDFGTFSPAPECKPSLNAEAQKEFAKHRRAEVECMHAVKEPTGGEMYTYVWWWVTLFWDFPCEAHRMWGGGG